MKVEHDVAALRVAFRAAFEARGGRSLADLRAVYDHFDRFGTGELERGDVQALLKWIHLRRVSRDHFERVWLELNVDGSGGIAFADFEAFLEPAFAGALPEDVAPPAIDLSAEVAAAPTPRKRFGFARVLAQRKKQAAAAAKK